MNEARLPSTRGRAAFTLAELLVVMGLIAILATITVVAVGAIANEARLSSGKNTVIAALDNARSLALKNNQLVLVAFRAKPKTVVDGGRVTEQVIEAVTAIWTGESYLDIPAGLVVDRFVPIRDVPTRELPAGVKVAAPLYIGADENWATSSDLPAIGALNPEVAGVVCAVMYAPDGSVVTQNSRSDSNRIFVDFTSQAGKPMRQRQGGMDYDYTPGDPDSIPDYPSHEYCNLGDDDDGTPIEEFYCQDKADDEPFLLMAPFLAVFDDAEAREILDPSRWIGGGSVERVEDLTEYINERADRIHFNRYTGVAMK